MSRRRVDLASLVLLLVGLIGLVGSYWLVSEAGANPLSLVPATIAATVGATHLTKREAR